MIEPDASMELDIDDEALDAGVAAWFSVRQVRAGEPILRVRLRAAIATALAARAAGTPRSLSSRPSPTHHALRNPPAQ